MFTTKYAVRYIILHTTDWYNSYLHICTNCGFTEYSDGLDACTAWPKLVINHSTEWWHCAIWSVSYSRVPQCREEEENLRARNQAKGIVMGATQEYFSKLLINYSYWSIIIQNYMCICTIALTTTLTQPTRLELWNALWYCRVMAHCEQNMGAPI